MPKVEKTPSMPIPLKTTRFIVLDGAARFVVKEGEISVLTRNQGIMLPKGTYYRFESCGETPVVLLRVGAAKERPKISRINPEGKPLPGNFLENRHEEGIPIEGRYYE